MKKLLFLLVAMACLVGCASQTTIKNTPFSKVEKQNSRVMQGGLDKVWHAAVTGLSKDFFVLDHIEKSSKIITLSFSVADPEPYVDCGKVTVTNAGGISGNGTFTFPFARKDVEFMASDGTPHAKKAKRTVKLSGKINLVFTAISQRETKVAINIKYVLDGKVDAIKLVPVGLSGVFQAHTETFSESFTTGQPSQTCTSKNSLEKLVLDKIESELSF